VVAVGLTFVVAAAVGAEVPVPSVTMPLLVTLPGVAAVCANAGKAAASETSTAKRTAYLIGAAQAASCPAPTRGSSPPGRWIVHDRLLMEVSTFDRSRVRGGVPKP
jgi:hypothetical protein